ncbi:hypothetical protein XENOCAPTIV_013387, partial [Xenoophorus captivus]
TRSLIYSSCLKISNICINKHVSRSLSITSKSAPPYPAAISFSTAGGRPTHASPNHLKSRFDRGHIPCATASWAQTCQSH